MHSAYNHIQRNLSSTDTLGTKIIVMISEASLFQRENNLYKVGTQSSVLINQGVLISEVSFKREVPLYLLLSAGLHVVSAVL